MQTEPHLAKIYRTINTAMLNADTKTLDRLLDDNFTLTHITGYVQPKAEWLDEVKSGRMAYLNIQKVKVTANQNGNYAIIIGQAHTTANIWGAKGTWRLQLEYRAVQQNGEWKVQQGVATLFKET
ncbi:nuclear transport factor 2 family protein [Actinobacillus suis]|uniref:nuclear transport factor 2 family protein n=1 Tax=Actinobacillus suis TaxID=716 RepID=UPI00207C30AA|nr:nuclear transport factor 2 family protein [Actinobacillus suis]MCO4166917.1 nuclear transport factor 2 family protein [Actinobacillus suis]MCO4168268.1 nuclear transport factor 2 family protein [Actinobacillus suis]